MVLGLLAHVTPAIFFGRILRSEALVYNSFFFFRTAVLRKLFDMRFSYKHCNFSRVCLLFWIFIFTIRLGNAKEDLKNTARKVKITKLFPDSLKFRKVRRQSFTQVFIKARNITHARKVA